MSLLVINIQHTAFKFACAYSKPELFKFNFSILLHVTTQFFLNKLFKLLTYNKDWIAKKKFMYLDTKFGNKCLQNIYRVNIYSVKRGVTHVYILLMLSSHNSITAYYISSPQCCHQQDGEKDNIRFVTASVEDRKAKCVTNPTFLETGM